MWRRALAFSCSLAFVVASCKTKVPSVPAAPVVDSSSTPAAPDVAGADRTDGDSAARTPEVNRTDAAPGVKRSNATLGVHRADGAPGADSADDADDSSPCRTRDDCGCTTHYTPTRAPRTRSADGGTRDESPRDCIIRCEGGRCKATQAPL